MTSSSSAGKEWSGKCYPIVEKHCDWSVGEKSHSVTLLLLLLLAKKWAERKFDSLLWVKTLQSKTRKALWVLNLRVSVMYRRSGEKKKKNPRNPRCSLSKLAFAWEEIFECNLHVAGSRPEATIQGFACELWGNRDIAEHSCWGKAYLCCCLSCCRCCWQEAGGGPGRDRRLVRACGGGCLYCPLFCWTGSPFHRKWLFWENSLDAHIETVTWERKRVSYHCGLCQTARRSDQREDLSHSPGGLQVESEISDL